MYAHVQHAFRLQMYKNAGTATPVQHKDVRKTTSFQARVYGKIYVQNDRLEEQKIHVRPCTKRCKNAR